MVSYLYKYRTDSNGTIFFNLLFKTLSNLSKLVQNSFKTLGTRPDAEHVFLEQFFLALVGGEGKGGGGEGDENAFRFVRTCCEEEVTIARVGVINGMCQLMDALLDRVTLSFSPSDMEPEIERLFLFALVWSVGGRVSSRVLDISKVHLLYMLVVLVV